MNESIAQSFPHKIKTDRLILQKSSPKLAQSLVGYRSWRDNEIKTQEVAAARLSLENDDTNRFRYYVYVKQDPSQKARGYIEFTFGGDPSEPVEVFCNTVHKNSIRNHGIATEAAEAAIGAVAKKGYRNFSAAINGNAQNTPTPFRLAEALGFQRDLLDSDSEQSYFFMTIAKKTKGLKGFDEFEM